jgi:hypothetical protein
MKARSEQIGEMHGFDLSPPVGAMSKFAFLLVLGVLASAIDLAVSFLYWAQHGVPATQVLTSIASWVLGPRPAATGPVFAIGLSLLYLIYLSMTVALATLLARRGRHARLWFVPGAAFGIVFYVVVYRVLVPVLVYPTTVSQSPEWVATCMLLHGLLIGPLLAWALTRRAAGKGAN